MITTRRHRAALATQRTHFEQRIDRIGRLAETVWPRAVRNATSDACEWLRSRADGYDADANHPSGPDDEKRAQRRAIQLAIATELRNAARDLEAR